MYDKEKRAIELLGSIYKEDELYESAQMAIKAIEEVQQYREIGSVEECRSAVLKGQGAIPNDIDEINETGFCPFCNSSVIDFLGNRYKYCHECGQKLAWPE